MKFDKEEGLSEKGENRLAAVALVVMVIALLLATGFTIYLAHNAADSFRAEAAAAQTHAGK